MRKCCEAQSIFTMSLSTSTLENGAFNYLKLIQIIDQSLFVCHQLYSLSCDDNDAVVEIYNQQFQKR